MPPTRKDRIGEHRTALEKNKKIIFQMQNICGICGLPVDMSLKYPDPMSRTVDHIIPIDKGGHPSDLSNLQLAHRYCNRQKGARLFLPGQEKNLGINSGRDSKGRPKKDPGIKKNARKAEEDSGIQTRENDLSGDNDDLPLHADWATLSW
ncbi:MAG: HNH endonuclease [Parasporobacterium sp.]|nr:HNH endonuclease [Parasporobacterium sp.]